MSLYPLSASFSLSLSPQIRSLEETLNDTEERYSSELSRLRRILIDLEVELCQLRGRVERQADAHQDLLHVKLRLEAEIENYRQLLHSIASDEDRFVHAVIVDVDVKNVLVVFTKNKLVGNRSLDLHGQIEKVDFVCMIV